MTHPGSRRPPWDRPPLYEYDEQAVDGDFAEYCRVCWKPNPDWAEDQTCRKCREEEK